MTTEKSGVINQLVSWDQPEFTDNSGDVSLIFSTHSNNSGNFLINQAVPVKYVIQDGSKLTADCSFFVRVEGNLLQNIFFVKIEENWSRDGFLAWNIAPRWIFTGKCNGACRGYFLALPYRVKKIQKIIQVQIEEILKFVLD